MRSILITASGNLAPIDAAPLAAGRVHFEQTDVVTLHNPVLETLGVTMVGVIDDWGATKQLPINIKAWALYGRSAIHGDMILGADDERELDPKVFDMLCRSWRSFTPEYAQIALTRFAEELGVSFD